MGLILSALTSKLAGPLAMVAAIALAIALSVSTIKLHLVQHELATAQNTIGQLKGSLDFQNLQVSQMGTKTAEAQKAARSAVAASRQAHAQDDVQVAAILAVPVENDPTKACAAADAAILEFSK